ncbi:MAG: prolipoprotein diacylglyceryl transferase [Phycisphaerales bacterium]
MFTLAAWTHSLSPFAVEFTPGVGLRWYGLAYLAGFVVAWALLRALGKRGLIRIPPEKAADVIFTLIVGVLLGGRLGYVLVYDRSLLLEFTPTAPWWGVLAINRGGMASHGAFVGLVAASWWVARANRISTLHVMDALALVGLPGVFLGRVANFVNGELLGRIVAMPGETAPWWAVRFPTELLEGHAPPLTPEQQNSLFALLQRVAPGEPYGEAMRLLIRDIQHGASGLARDITPLLAARHPSQLYQAGVEGMLVPAALWLIWRRPRRPGVIVAWFFVLYGIGRIVTEFWRLPDAQLAAHTLGATPGGLSYGQWLSAGMIIAGALTLLVVRARGHAPTGGWGPGARAEA